MAVGSAVRVALALIFAYSHAALIRNHQRGEVDAPNDVHDGTISQWEPGGDFFWYGMSYTSCRMNDGWMRPVYQAINLFVSTLAPMAATCNGFNCAPIAFKRFGVDCGFLTAPQGQTIKVWRSPDLTNWTEEPVAALDATDPLLQEAILFRPAVIYNPTTRKYVLWVNRIPKGYSVWDGYTRGGYLVAEADAPTGPFAIKSRQPAMEFGGGGDYAILADGPRAWIAYGSWDNGFRTEGMHAYLPAELNAGHRIAVQPLSDDFTDVASGVAASTVTAPDQEAPTLFKHAGMYYLLHGDVCCFCPQGSDAKVLVAADPMGNWTHVANLNPYGRGRHVAAQSNSVFEVGLANGSTQLVWTGDLWQSARSGLKGDDVQFWLPLEFEWRSGVVAGADAPVAVPRPVRWVDSFELELPPADGKECSARTGRAE